MIRINLAPPSAKRGIGLSIPSFNLGMLFGAVALGLVVVLGGWWWSLSSEIKRLNTEIAENKQQSEKLKVVIAEGQRFRRDKELLERRVNAIELVARNKTRPVYLLDAVLAPIEGNAEYNHLSVRAACAILLDRLRGDREGAH